VYSSLSVAPRFERLLHGRRMPDLQACAHVHDRLLDLDALDEAHSRRLDFQVRAVDVLQDAHGQRQALFVPRQDVQAIAGGGQQEIVARGHQVLRLRCEAELEAGVPAPKQLLDGKI
jgi:hypothetical protein